MPCATFGGEFTAFLTRPQNLKEKELSVVWSLRLSGWGGNRQTLKNEDLKV